MAYSGLKEFIDVLRRENELIEIKEYVNPLLEITEIVDRFSKADDTKNKALLFTNTGTSYPLLINSLGSEKRICLALGCNTLDEHTTRIEHLFSQITSPKKSFFDKISMLPLVTEFTSWMPKHNEKHAACQEVIEKDVDLFSLPILQCWKYDAGRFITLPMVFTQHPETGTGNIGMYRMQVIDKQTTGMHWHPHKTGDNHYQAYKKLGKRMPVSVALGGDPAMIFSATAPLPEGIDESILCGFLRQKSLKLTKCLTNDLEVPADADFILEGYVDPEEDMFLEGPFGDHTGFYSLPDYYPKFHITCITHRREAVYPATIVGIPPMEDAWIGKATERIFLAPIRFVFCPELIDYVMPFAGVSHNLVIAKIKKTYEGQVQKVINALWGAGQMANNKTLIIVDEFCNINDKNQVKKAIETNFCPQNDSLIMSGPLDVLDHSSEKTGYGSKLAIDATQKNETYCNTIHYIPCDAISKKEKIKIAKNYFAEHHNTSCIILYDNTLSKSNTFSILWHILNNYNPKQDCLIETFDSTSCLIIDGTSKLFNEQQRDIPSPVVSDKVTRETINKKWNKLNIGEMLPSPSDAYEQLAKNTSAWRYRD